MGNLFSSENQMLNIPPIDRKSLHTSKQVHENQWANHADPSIKNRLALQRKKKTLILFLYWRHTQMLLHWGPMLCYEGHDRSRKKVNCKLLLYSGCCRQRQQKQPDDASGHAGCTEEGISGRLGKLLILKGWKSQNAWMVWLCFKKPLKLI